MTEVLVTRPRTVAEPLIASLKQLGYAIFHEPLLTIAPTKQAPPDITNIQAVMITSQCALWALKQTGTDSCDILNKPCYCIGARTAEAAQDFGFKQVTFSEGDGRKLAELVKVNLPVVSSPSILYLAGEDTASAAQRLLMEAGYRIAKWPLYKAHEMAHFSPVLQEKLRQHKLSAALFFSPRTAGAFARLVAQYKLQACCEGLTAIGMSDAAIPALRPFSWGGMAVADIPSEEAMTACLQRLCPVS